LGLQRVCPTTTKKRQNSFHHHTHNTIQKLKNALACWVLFEGLAFFFFLCPGVWWCPDRVFFELSELTSSSSSAIVLSNYQQVKATYSSKIGHLSSINYNLTVMEQATAAAEVAATPAGVHKVAHTESNGSNLSQLAYSKIFMHAAKYPYGPVAGFVIGKKTGNKVCLLSTYISVFLHILLTG
jgi:hypothetical protein